MPEICLASSSTSSRSVLTLARVLSTSTLPVISRSVTLWSLLSRYCSRAYEGSLEGCLGSVSLPVCHMGQRSLTLLLRHEYWVQLAAAWWCALGVGQE